MKLNNLMLVKNSKKAPRKPRNKSNLNKSSNLPSEGQGRNPKVLKKDSGTDFMSKYVMW